MFVNTDWHAGMQDVSLSINGAFGEPVIVTPAGDKRPNFTPRPDVSNAFETVAVFSWRSKLVFKQNSGTMFQSQEPIAETRVPTFSFDRNSLPWGLQHLDQITRACDGATFEITRVEPDGVSRIVAHCVECGRQSQ